MSGSLDKAVRTACDRWVFSCRDLKVESRGVGVVGVLTDGMVCRVLLVDGEEVRGVRFGR